MPIAQRGVMDLRSWNFTDRGMVPLKGQWEFYWQHFVSDGINHQKPEYISSGMWNNHKSLGKKIGGTGYGTYRLRLLLPPKHPKLAIASGYWHTAARFIISGQTYSIGSPAKNAKQTQPITRKDIIEIGRHLGAEVDIIVDAANFFHRSGGMIEAPTIGLSSDIYRHEMKNALWQGMLAAIFVIFGFYHLVLHAIRKNTGSFWFGVFCILFTLQTVLTTDQIIKKWFPEMDFRVFLAISYIDLFLILSVASKLFHVLFPLDISLGVRNFFIIFPLIFCFTVLLPEVIYSRLLIAFYLPLLFFVIYIIIALIIAKFRRRPTALTFLGGFAAIGLGAIGDMYSSVYFSQTTPFSKIGMLAFMFAQSIVIAQRYNHAFLHIEHLSDELEIKNEDLKRLDKLKDEFLSNTSHELRSPLSGMIGLAESMKSKLRHTLDETSLINLDMIISSGRRLSTLINDILDFARVRNKNLQLEKKLVDIRCVAETVLQNLKPLTRGKEIILRNDIPFVLPPAWADENRIYQILFNLIHNAIKFTHSGEIIVDGRLVSEPSKAVAASANANASAKTNEQMLHFSITDSGIGISPDNQERIFNPFEQADGSIERKYGGTGLGLAIVKSLIELHGGLIWVESTSHKISPNGQYPGSRFCFTLPIGDSDINNIFKCNGPDEILTHNVIISSSSSSSSSSSNNNNNNNNNNKGFSNGNEFREGSDKDLITQRQSKRGFDALNRQESPIILDEASEAANHVAIDETTAGLKVLAVDDDPVNLEVIANNLSSAGFATQKATSGAMALKQIDVFQPDIILLDIMMPEMNGYETAHRIRIKYPLESIPIIFLTARHHELDLTQSFEMGGNDFMRKPFFRAELISRIILHSKLARLLKQERFSVIGQLATGIVHDLRNHLASIKTMADLLATYKDAGAERDLWLGWINKAADNLTDMTAAILDYVRGDIKLSRQTIGLVDFLAEIKEFIDPAFAYEHKTIILGHIDSVKFSCDQNRMRRAIINIANNAREALSKDGQLFIEAKFIAKGSSKEILLDKIILSFTDNGKGVPKEHQDSIFLPFTTWGKNTGTGLGLASVKQVIDAHGGTVQCQSPTQGNIGSRFIIELPLGFDF